MFVPSKEENQASVQRMERKKQLKRDNTVPKLKKGWAYGFANAGLSNRLKEMIGSILGVLWIIVIPWERSFSAAVVNYF